jgi:penicillin amidase
MNNPYSPWWNNQVTKRVETSTVIIQRAWKNAIDSLVTQLGDDPARWTWDKVHTLEFQHPFGKSPLIRSLFNVGPFPVPGTRETVNHFGFSLATEECSVTDGPSFRHLISVGDPGGALGVSPLGQSGNVLDPHYQDQTPLYLANGYRRKLLSKADVEADTQSVLRLLPPLPEE